MNPKIFFLFVFVLLLNGCIPAAQDESFVVSLVADGRERAYPQDAPITVGEFLRRVDVELGPLDEINPPEFTQIIDGMRVTVVRVEETTQCDRQEIPRRQRRVPNEGLAPGEERLGQAGQNGIEEICYRVILRDGQPQEPIPISRTRVTEPQDEVIYIGPNADQLDPVPITGTLAYINNNNVWIMRESSTTRRPLTSTNDLDGRVFALSADGRQLLFTRETQGTDRESFFNRLWLINDTARETAPLALLPENVLYADWVPNTANAISYSTGEVASGAPGWLAHNDLSIMRIDLQSGETLDLDQLVNRSTGGLYGWWGTQYQWSPDGARLAWVRADRLGLVDLTTGALNDTTPLLTYNVFNTRGPWSWRANVSWSADNSLILTTVHGAPIGSEPPDTSPAFHVAVASVDGAFTAEVVRNAGIWSAPKYAGERMAYLTARDLSNSISEAAEYDLVVADRDGSNAEVVFPASGEPGLTRDAVTFTWNPDGTEIAFIYQGNLWIVDVISGISHQLTLDGGATRPIWTR
ncbi:MAG: DPP IV N-terminal domain-containing protein [bacterium]|nr:DPP IV N-terminal domain-containing protein [bacterium]